MTFYYIDNLAATVGMQFTATYLSTYLLRSLSDDRLIKLRQPGLSIVIYNKNPFDHGSSPRSYETEIK